MGGSGTTTTSGIIPPELQGLYRGSAERLLGQQKGNDIGQYNAEHPLQVEGANPLQTYGSQISMAGAHPGAVDGLALQSILREPGLAGAGPTTGQYDYGSEAGLGDIMSYLGVQGYTNASPSHADPGADYSGLGDAFGHADGAYGGVRDNYPSPAGLPTDNAAYQNGDNLMHPRPDGTPGRPGQGPYGGPTPGGGGGQAPNPGQGHSFGGGSDPRAEMRSSWNAGPDSIMSKYGIGTSFSGDNGGTTTFSKGGKSFSSVGSSHEGAGPGDQSKFLNDVLGNGGSGNSTTDYRAVRDADRALASVGQHNRYDQTRKFMAGQETPAQVAARQASAMGQPEPKKKVAVQ